MTAAEIRDHLTHPVIDVDGHMIEYFPALSGYLRKEGIDPASPSMQRLVPGAFGPTLDWHSLTTEQRAARRVPRPPWWGSPARNTRDLATAMFPALLHERLPELGIDFSVVYPSIGLVYLHVEDERERRGACRALNRYNAEAFADLGDRLCPVAAIPMVTPDEAIDELDHAVGELGFRAVVMNGFVQRPAAAFAESHPDLARWGMWVDTYGVDSAYDYDPVWQKCRELGVPPSFHSGSMGWGSRMSYSSYMHNHIGQLNEGNHAVCKSLFLGGVTRRFPDVSFAFMEGGVAWAAMLFVDLIGHWEKRHIGVLDTLDPAAIDSALLGRLRDEYGGKLLELAAEAAKDAPANQATRAAEDPSTLDEWVACEITSVEDIRDLFVPRFFFGCEADDPMTSTAFNPKVNPFGARLNAVFGSDIADWDVPDMSEVLEEAWEMVEHELVTEADFRDFVFTNPLRLYTGGNPAFFEGTTVEAAVAAERASPRG